MVRPDKPRRHCERSGALVARGWLASVRSSFAPVRRLNPTISTARIAASFRCFETRKSIGWRACGRKLQTGASPFHPCRPRARVLSPRSRSETPSTFSLSARNEEAYAMAFAVRGGTCTSIVLPNGKHGSLTPTALRQAATHILSRPVSRPPLARAVSRSPLSINISRATRPRSAPSFVRLRPQRERKSQAARIDWRREE